VNTGRTFPTGVGAEADGVAASTMYQLHDGEFDLDELEAWAARRFDTRWFKQTAYPHAFYPQGQQHYLRELSKRIRLGTSQTALSLLGKAKAMKNVGDLNLFVRENMLDEPDTWAAAERALAAFTPLNNAYNTAKRARDQEQVLHELPAAWAAYTAADEAGERAAALQGARLTATCAVCSSPSSIASLPRWMHERPNSTPRWPARRSVATRPTSTTGRSTVNSRRRPRTSGRLRQE
jgi:hypothetical protein